MVQLERYVELLRSANAEQNLVSGASLDQVWERHIIDSAQLARYEPHPRASWIDIGSGAGLPGIVVAVLVKGPVTLVEPRRLRAEFLVHAVDQLGLAERVRVICSKADKVGQGFDVITARAVASLERLLSLTVHLSHSGTIWILPKGRKANMELAQARRSWQCVARSEASRTDPESRVLVLSEVRARANR